MRTRGDRRPAHPGIHLYDTRPPGVQLRELFRSLEWSPARLAMALTPEAGQQLADVLEDRGRLTTPLAATLAALLGVSLSLLMGIQERAAARASVSPHPHPRPHHGE